MIGSLALIALAVLQVSPPVLAPDDSAALARLEREWNEAHLRGDATALDHLWAEDLTVAVPEMAPMGKPEALAFARSGRMRFEVYASSDLRYRVFGDAAVVTGQLARTRTLRGRRLEDRWRFTKVYVRRPEGWRVVAFHASAAPK